jgi:uncharacterized lipoprotein YbaY
MTARLARAADVPFFHAWLTDKERATIRASGRVVSRVRVASSDAAVALVRLYAVSQLDACSLM